MKSLFVMRKQYFKIFWHLIRRLIIRMRLCLWVRAFSLIWLLESHKVVWSYKQATSKLYLSYHKQIQNICTSLFIKFLSILIAVLIYIYIYTKHTKSYIMKRFYHLQNLISKNKKGQKYIFYLNSQIIAILTYTVKRNKSKVNLKPTLFQF